MKPLSGGMEEGPKGVARPSLVPPPGTVVPTARPSATLPRANDAAVPPAPHMRPPDRTVPAPRSSMGAHGVYATREVDGEAGPRARRPRLQDAFTHNLDPPQEPAQLSPSPTIAEGDVEAGVREKAGRAVEGGEPLGKPVQRQASRASLYKDSSAHGAKLGWTPDRGHGYYSKEREKRKRPSLVATGKHAGRSRVQYTNTPVLMIHQWSRDFFISALETPLSVMVIFISLAYLATFFIFSGFYWAVNTASPHCMYGVGGYMSIFIFSMITQQTIGYGNTGPNGCWAPALLICIQTLLGMFMDAITIGLVFARISHPKYRGRTIGISDSAVIARRDGILKFMFRVADFRRTQVVQPTVKAFLYLWGEGRTTAEGEFIPVRVEELNIGYIDGMLLLPIIIEHTIDERSPLCGHTYDTLMAMNAEIIVTFEGTTEFGNPFMARQSYLASEIHWGYRFVPIIMHPAPGDTHYTVDLARLHDVEPLEGLHMMPASQLSRMVVGKALRCVPYPLLGENTLVLSDSLTLAPDDDGNLALMFRVGDTYPNQHLEVVVKAYFYRWNPTDRPAGCGLPTDYEVKHLDCGYEDGRERLLLWLPIICKHVIDDSSPLANWRDNEGFMRDANCTVAVVVEGYMYTNSQNRMRMRMYNVLRDIKREQAFYPIVTSPADSPDFKPRINWGRFHDTVPIGDSLPGAHVEESLEQRRKRMVETLRRDSVVRTDWTDTPEDSSVLTPDMDPTSTFRWRSATERHGLHHDIFPSQIAG